MAIIGKFKNEGYCCEVADQASEANEGDQARWQDSGMSDHDAPLTPGPTRIVPPYRAVGQANAGP